MTIRRGASEHAHRAATILVLDGFGIGAMPDAGDLRPGDTRADTLGSLQRWSIAHRGRSLNIPYVATLGLAALRPELRLVPAPGLDADLTVVARRSALGYPGADTFAGHQAMMGADMSHVTLCRLAERLTEVRAALEVAGHRTDLLGGLPVVVVDGQMLVHDNLEADPGLNWNVSAPLDRVRWEDLLHAARAVRGVAPVARVIAVGGHGEGPLARFVRAGDAGTVGLDTPASGFYRHSGLRVQHLGAPIDHHRQLPEVAGAAGIPVTLVGKAADILTSALPVVRQPGVDTAQVLMDTRDAAQTPGLVVANVQQTDLAGHQQDPARYADLLEQVDEAIAGLLRDLRPGGLLVVVADHGNDPCIGHAYHTRELVPVLAAGHSLASAPPPVAPHLAADLDSLADVGASVAKWLHLGSHALGHGHAHDLLNIAPKSVRRTRA